MAQAIAQAESALISPNLTTDSRVSADRFERRHADVLRAIDTLEVPENYRERSFALCSYRPCGATRDYPYCEMTRDGFALLVMGFTGAKAFRLVVPFWAEHFSSIL